MNYQTYRIATGLLNHINKQSALVAWLRRYVVLWVRLNVIGGGTKQRASYLLKVPGFRLWSIESTWTAPNNRWTKIIARVWIMQNSSATLHSDGAWWAQIGSQVTASHHCNKANDDDCSRILTQIHRTTYFRKCHSPIPQKHSTEIAMYEQVESEVQGCQLCFPLPAKTVSLSNSRNGTISAGLRYAE